MAIDQTVLEVRGLRTLIHQRRSIVRAVDGVSLYVNAGETLGLVGESGCGKTMTAMSILRLLPRGGEIVEGSISLLGQNIIDLDESSLRKVRGRDAAIVFQDSMTALDPTMTVGRQIAESVRAHRGWSWERSMDRAAEVLGLVGVPRPRERLGAYPHQLSGGLRQRVMIAIALANQPRLLIADEPTTALDVTIQAQILRLLTDLKNELGMAVLLITHDLGVIAGHADRVAVMYAGKVVEEGPAQAIFANMSHPYTQALMQSIPLPGQRRSDPLYSIPGQPPDLTDPPRACRFSPRCRYASAICFSDEPRLEGEASTHRYACFHPLDRNARPSSPEGDRLRP